MLIRKKLKVGKAAVWHGNCCLHPSQISTSHVLSHVLLAHSPFGRLACCILEAVKTGNTIKETFLMGKWSTSSTSGETTCGRKLRSMVDDLRK